MLQLGGVNLYSIGFLRVLNGTSIYIGDCERLCEYWCGRKALSWRAFSRSSIMLGRKLKCEYLRWMVALNEMLTGEKGYRFEGELSLIAGWSRMMRSWRSRVIGHWGG